MRLNPSSVPFPFRNLPIVLSDGGDGIDRAFFRFVLRRKGTSRRRKVEAEATSAARSCISAEGKTSLGRLPRRNGQEKFRKENPGRFRFPKASEKTMCAGEKKGLRRGKIVE